LFVAKRAHNAIVAAREAASVVAAALGEALDGVFSVTAVMVLVEPNKITTLNAPGDVFVLTSMQLEQWLLSSPSAMAGEDVARISGAAEANSTWPQPQQAAQKSRNLTRAFVRVHHDVRSATLRRFLWIAAALIATTIAVWVLVLILTSLVVR
jgi:hypothetical protein